MLSYVRLCRALEVALLASVFEVWGVRYVAVVLAKPLTPRRAGVVILAATKFG